MEKYLLETINTHKQKTIKSLLQRKEKIRHYPISASDLLIMRSCPLCHSPDIVPVAEVYYRGVLNFLSTSTCRRCLFTFRSISPSLSWFKRRWQQIYTGTLEVFNNSVEQERLKRYRMYINLIKRYIRGDKILEVGAAYGTGANTLRNAGFNVEVIEAEISKRNYIRKVHGIKIVASSIEEYTQKKKSYDCIVFSHCLEHIDHPCRIMHGLSNLVNKNHGIVYLEVPILWYYVNWSDALFMTHKSNFTEKNLHDLANESGFEVQETQLDKNSGYFGMILRISRKVTPPGRLYKRDPKYTIDDVRKLYRKNLPIRRLPYKNSVLRYSVPHIDHFFQTLRLERKEIQGPKYPSDFMTFVPANGKRNRTVPNRG